jgi:hypothetical protein
MDKNTGKTKILCEKVFRMNDRRRRHRECFEEDGVTKQRCLDPFCGCKPTSADDPWVAFFGNRRSNTNEPYPVRWHVPEEASPFATSLRKHERLMALMALISHAQEEPVHPTSAQ